MRSGSSAQGGVYTENQLAGERLEGGGLSSPTAAVTLPGWSIAGQEPRLAENHCRPLCPPLPPHPTPPLAVSQLRRWKQADPPQEAGDPLQVSTPLCPVLFMTPQHIQGAQGAQSRLGSRWKTQ